MSGVIEDDLVVGPRLLVEPVPQDRSNAVASGVFADEQTHVFLWNAAPVGIGQQVEDGVGVGFGVSEIPDARIAVVLYTDDDSKRPLLGNDHRQFDVRDFA